MPLTSLGDLTLPAESTDAEMAFRLVLGRRPARAGDLEAHLGKPLDEVFTQVKCISGSTILGSGEVALILDVPQLVHQALAGAAAARPARVLETAA